MALVDSIGTTHDAPPVLTESSLFFPFSTQLAVRMVWHNQAMIPYIALL